MITVIIGYSAILRYQRYLHTLPRSLTAPPLKQCFFLEGSKPFLWGFGNYSGGGGGFCLPGLIPKLQQPWIHGQHQPGFPGRFGVMDSMIPSFGTYKFFGGQDLFKFNGNYICDYIIRYNIFS